MGRKRVFYGLFDDEEDLLKAVKNVRAEGLKIMNCFTPFPVHGLDEAMGIKDTRLHTAGFIFGSTGLIASLGFMIWVSTTNYPIDFGGKPQIALPAFLPIAFEITVLMAAVGMVFTYLYVNRLAPGNTVQVLDERTTSHLFAMAFDIDESTEEENIEALKTVLTANGAIEFGQKEVDVEEEGILQQII